MQKERKDKHFIKKPIYPGGREALQKFIVKHLEYPEEALEKKIEGTVSLKYTIDYKGKVIDSHVISGLGYGCDEEALRLANLLRFEVPKTSRKVRVHFHKDLHIHFRLPKRKPADGAASTSRKKITYQYTQKSRQSKSGKSDSRGSYSYTITVSGD